MCKPLCPQYSMMAALASSNGCQFWALTSSTVKAIVNLPGLSNTPLPLALHTVQSESVVSAKWETVSLPTTLLPRSKDTVLQILLCSSCTPPMRHHSLASALCPALSSVYLSLPRTVMPFAHWGNNSEGDGVDEPPSSTLCFLS